MFREDGNCFAERFQRLLLRLNILHTRQQLHSVNIKNETDSVQRDHSVQTQQTGSAAQFQYRGVSFTFFLRDSRSSFLRILGKK